MHAFAPHLIALPLIVTASGTFVTLLAAAFAARGRASFIAATATVFGALLSLAATYRRLPGGYTDLLYIDGVAALAMGLVLFASLCVLILAEPYLDRHDLPSGEFSLLILVGTLGGLVLASSAHFVSLFLGIELLGIPLVALTAFHRARDRSVEAGFKYLILAGLSSAFLLFGIALLYARTGDLSYASLLTAPSPLLHLGMALLVVGMAFKLALVPFHFWAPDVYDGAPAPVTAFAATAVKAAVFAALLRIFPPEAIAQDRFLVLLFAVISFTSMTLGNIAAVRQRNVKRLLAYSSIAHNGYLLIAFLSPGTFATTAVLLFLASYVVTNLAAFGVVTSLSHPDRDADDLEEYTGLAWRQAVPAAIMLIAMLSLLGLPLTSGFIAKFSVIAAGVGAAHLFLVVALAVNTVISAYYYLRVVMTMFRGPEEAPSHLLRHPVHNPTASGTVVLLFQVLLMLAIGIAPQLALRLIKLLLS